MARLDQTHILNDLDQGYNSKNFADFSSSISIVLILRPLLTNLFKASLFLVALALCSSCSEGDPAEFNIQDYKGKWLVLNYWAIWCGPCEEEMPELNELQKSYADELTVLGVNYDDKKGEELLKDIRSIGMEFGYLESNPANQLKLSRPEGLPVTYLFSPDGVLAAKLVGPQSQSDILERIASLGGSLMNGDK